ncbi:hypothetical protein IT418_00810 [bacterium]|nr:hypothetical protein [bacterium]
MNNTVLERFKNYLKLIHNSTGTKMFRNLYVTQNGVSTDITQNGLLSCALFTSTILYICKYIHDIHATVESTIKDLKQNGWTEITKPLPGAVIVWKNHKDTAGHSHIGFYVGNNKAISNDSQRGYPRQSDWKFKGEREVEVILWNPEIEKEQARK